MPAAVCSDEEFIALFEANGAEKTATLLRINVRGIHERRRRMEEKYDRLLRSPNTSGGRPALAKVPLYPNRLAIDLQNGCALIGSDAHIQPGLKTTAFRAYVFLAKELKPRMAVLNGDVLDFPTISRHDPLGWNKKPRVQEELDETEEQVGEIRRVVPKAILLWTLGNHDMRFENRLAQRSPEYEGVRGTCLSDHFPHWKFCVSAEVNGRDIIKHRFKSGTHATHNNTLWAGRTIFTGHLHSLKATPFSDYNGVRWGVDTGTMAEIDGEHADYDEDNPKNHRSGLIVATYRNGRLLWPEIVHVLEEGKISFRGEIISV